MPHVRFQVPFLGPESQLKSGFACAGLLCIGLERVTSVFRLIQTMLVLLEWLLPLLEDVRPSANQRDIIAMFRDHLRDLETEMQRQICEMRDHILGRYRRSLQG